MLNHLTKDSAAGAHERVNAGPDSSWCIGHVATGIDEQARQHIHAQASEEKKNCAGCAVRDRCNNTCGCLNWQTTGNVNQVSPVLCRHEQMLLPIADRLGERLYRRCTPELLHKHYSSAYPVLSLLEETLDTSVGDGRDLPTTP